MKNTAIAITAALLAATPANAVDYLQCREMLRTRNEMVRKAVKAEIGFERINSKSAYDMCPNSMFQTEKMSFGYKYTTTDYDAKRACEEKVEEENKAAFKKKFKPLGKDYQGAELYSPEGLRWAKAYGKVAADMRAAGCPYE